MTDNHLVKLREEIDEIDDSIIELLNKRFSITDAVAKYKNKNNIGLTDTNREQAMVERMKQMNTHPALKGIIEKLYNVIIQANKDYRKSNM
jgi:chorismate mutase